MKFSFFSKSTDTAAAAASPWPWPACATNPKTQSFRATAAAAADNGIFKTINSAYVDDDDEALTELSAAADDDSGAAVEFAVVGALRSDRLIFHPGESSSILDEAKPAGAAVSILAVESCDPYSDFRASMEEMVEAHGLKDWDCLEDLLACYLRFNSKSNHGYIVGAFVDLLLRHAVAAAAASAIDENCSSSSTTTTTANSFTSPLSFSSSSTYSSASPHLSSPENEAPITTAAGKEDSLPSPSSSSSSSGT
ncbi:transcription repressor OFP15-like [Andrographis paniculata]|uniref:transcription repressor OFP15-like n=1 Tax=Andrographis paniculata TaxID=175694 RepID=UPI0021E6E70C|nr:transcription repressor OFP15-like [Andrographis paniculata]